MVMRIPTIRTTRNVSIHTNTQPRLLHAGQDTVCRFDANRHHQGEEIDAWCSITIDVHLLTGNLDEDISILNIVA